MKLDEKKIKKLSSNLSTPLSEISYILLAYALFTDGNVSEEENQAAIQITLDLGNDWNYEQEDIVSAYGEASEVCNGASKEELQAVFIDVLAKLDHQEDFKIAQRKKLIGYLESIMDADGVQHKNEIFYLDKIKELLKVEVKPKSIETEALEKLGTTKKDLTEKIVKNIEVSTKNPEAYAFVKSVSSKNADFNKIKEQLENGMDKFIDFADDGGYTAMHYACWDNKLLIVELLIDFGANTNSLSPTNETPLNMAVVSGHFDIVKFFVDYDVEMELNIEWEKRSMEPNPMSPENGSTLIRNAVLNQHWNIFDLLINGIAPNLGVLTEPCSVGFEGETNFFLAIEKLYQKKNIDYDKERLETIRSILEDSSNKETHNEEITNEMLEDGYTGQGTCSYGDGSKYVGDWKDGNMHGQGIYTWNNGNKHVGEFSNHDINGPGVLTQADGKISKGLWKKGLLVEVESNLQEKESSDVDSSADTSRNKKNTTKSAEKEVELKTENKTISKDASIWEIIQHEFINLGKESIVKKEFSSIILSKYPHIKKGTLSAQIAIQVINKRARTGYFQCGKERVCGDNKFDFLFEQEDKTLCKYDKLKHGTWEIYKRDDGKLDVRIVLTTSIDHAKAEEEKIDTTAETWIEKYKRENPEEAKKIILRQAQLLKDQQKNKNKGAELVTKGVVGDNIMDLKIARERFIEIGNKTGIHYNNIKQEPNTQERDELWDITRAFLKRIYVLDNETDLSTEQLKEYNDLCYWSIAALHWNDSLDKFTFDNGRHRRDTITLALCLYARISRDYEIYKNIKEDFIIPHAYGSVLLWVCVEIITGGSDIYFDKFDVEFTKIADDQRKVLFNKYGFYRKEDEDKDWDKIDKIWEEIHTTLDQREDKNLYLFLLTYIKNEKGLLQEDSDKNKAFFEKMLGKEIS